MIVDTMTFPEISGYLWKTAFGEKTMKGIEEIYRRRREDYQREIKKWERRPHPDEKYRIFKPTYYKGKNDEKVCIIFYSNQRGCIYFVCFLTFYHQGKKYLAFRPAGMGRRIVFFSLHALRRYSERFLGDPEAILDDVFLGDMLVFNNQTIEKEYTYDGKSTVALVSTDGSWLCEKHENCILAKTFIGEKEYFEGQREMDKDAIEMLRAYKQEVWGDTIDRE